MGAMRTRSLHPSSACQRRGPGARATRTLTRRVHPRPGVRKDVRGPARKGVKFTPTGMLKFLLSAIWRSAS